MPRNVEDTSFSPPFPFSAAFSSTSDEKRLNQTALVLVLSVRNWMFFLIPLSLHFSSASDEKWLKKEMAFILFAPHMKGGTFPGSVLSTLFLIF
jgi:hypothetical protein